jgi:hypothetical protein
MFDNMMYVTVVMVEKPILSLSAAGASWVVRNVSWLNLS